MGKIFAGQSSLSLQVHTGLDLTQTIAWEIRWTTPSGISGGFPASILGNPLDGILGYNLQEGDLNQAGWWNFWAWVKIGRAHV